MPLIPGTKLGPYEILSQLGAGGMGEVYKARDSRLSRDVALKILPSDVAGDPSRRARFESEARSASALNHPGIVAVYDIGQSDNALYIVTEVVDGATLRDSRPETLRKQIDVAAQVAEALAAAHAKGITHRDLKPDNIMVSREGRTKILDFGLAKNAGPISQQDSTQIAVNSEPGALMGTVGYMSPEQARGGTADARSDIFSFGAVLYELLSGNRAFTGDSAVEVLSAILKSDPPELPATIPNGLKQIVQRCVEKEPEQRFQSAKDLAFALRASVGDSSTSIGAAAPAVSQRGRSWGKWVTAGAGSALLGFLVAATFYAPRYPDTTAYRFKAFAMEAASERTPDWSPDGQAIAYTADDAKGIRQIFVRSLKSSTVVQLTKADTSCNQPQWAGSGERISYVAGNTLMSIGAAGGSPEVVRRGILKATLSSDGRIIASVEDARLRIGPLANPVLYKQAPFPDRIRNTTLRFSPDQTKLAVLTMPESGESLQGLWILPLPSGTPREYSAEGLSIFSFGWLPNGNIIVSARREREVFAQLFFLNLETGKFHQLTSGLQGFTEPAISPNGSKIAVVSGRSNQDIYDIRIDSSIPTPLLATSANERGASWSPNGNQYVYSTVVDGLSEIDLRSVTEGWSRPLITQESTGQPLSSFFDNPRFSPDGQRVVYEVAGQSHDLWVSSINGGKPVRLARLGDRHQHNGVWSADGNWIAYSTGQASLILKVSSNGGGNTSEVTSACGNLQWAPSVDWILCGREMRLISTSGSGTRELGGRTSARGFSNDAKEVYGLTFSQGKWELVSWSVTSGRQTKIREIALPANVTVSDFSLHPDGKHFATTVSTPSHDIMLLENFSLPSEHWWQRLNPFQSQNWALGR